MPVLASSVQQPVPRMSSSASLVQAKSLLWTWNNFSLSQLLKVSLPVISPDAPSACAQVCCLQTTCPSLPNELRASHWHLCLTQLGTVWQTHPLFAWLVAMPPPGHFAIPLSSVASGLLLLNVSATLDIAVGPINLGHSMPETCI